MPMTRMYAEEFGQTAKISKLIRHAFLKNTLIKHNIGRFTSQVLKIMRTDTTGKFEQRNFARADLSQLVGFGFNELAPLSAACHLQFQVSEDGAKKQIEVTIPEFVPLHAFSTACPGSHFGSAFYP